MAFENYFFELEVDKISIQFETNWRNFNRWKIYLQEIRGH